MTCTTRLSPALFAAAALLALPCVHGAAQDTQPPAQNEGGGVGGWLKKLGQGIDDAVKSGSQGAQGAVDTVNQTHAAVNGTVRGRVALQGGKTATCFHGITACYLGAANMTSPGQSQGVPALLVLADGRAVANNADQLAHFGVLVLPQPGTASGNADAGYSDPYGCTNPSWSKDEVVRRRREIMQCQSDAITERAAQRAQAKQTMTDAERKRAQEKLEADTKAQFEKIQRDAANPPK